ncbi:MAG: hypothetical protein U9R58_15635 [Chloroflexota bacterium]|nr:hypothetical protein [Chloroflexota bacterium]
MSTFDYEIRYLRAGVEELEDYLLSDELYGPIGLLTFHGERAYPSLTIGNMLLYKRRAEAYSASIADKNELHQVSQQLDRIRQQWRVAWGVKTTKEFRSRLRLWRDFLNDYKVKPDQNYDRYAYEVSRRVILQLLAPDADEIEGAELELLEILDQYLGSVFFQHKFIWDKVLAAVFTRDPYWYLYGRLPE